MAKEAKEKKEKVIAISLDQAEMAVRIMEGLTGSKRPAFKSPRECIEEMEEDKRESLFQASRLIAEYIYEQIIVAGARDVQFMDGTKEKDRPH